MPPLGDERHAVGGVNGPDQHRGRESFFFRDAVEKPVHPVGEINVGVTGRAVHDRGAGSAPGFCMAAQISFAHVGFGFEDGSGQTKPIFEVNKPRAQQVTGNLQSWASKKGTGEGEIHGSDATQT